MSTGPAYCPVCENRTDVIVRPSSKPPWCVCATCGAIIEVVSIEPLEFVEVTIERRVEAPETWDWLALASAVVQKNPEVFE